MRRTSSLFTLLLVLAPAALTAQPAPGVYVGTTGQKLPFGVEVSGGSIIQHVVGWSGPCGLGGTRIATESCAIEGNSFDCGAATDCVPGATQVRIYGTFAGPHVVGTATVRHSDGACCEVAWAIPLSGTLTSFVFGDGFENFPFALAHWSGTDSPGPYLDLWLRNPVWGGFQDTFQVTVGGGSAFTFVEGAPGWQATYRPLRVDLSSYAGTDQEIRLIATSGSTDGIPTDFELDDVAVTCLPSTGTAVLDGGFEATFPHAAWTEQSSTHHGTPICDPDVQRCSGADRARSGSGWVWFGDSDQFESGAIGQTVPIPYCD